MELGCPALSPCPGQHQGPALLAEGWMESTHSLAASLLPEQSLLCSDWNILLQQEGRCSFPFPLVFFSKQTSRLVW